MSTALSSWEKKIMPDVPGVPYPAMIDAVRDACIEFCKETWLYTYDLDRISIVAETQSYTLTVPTAAYGEIIAADEVKYKQDGLDDDQFVTLNPLSVEDKERAYGASWIFQTAPTPSEFWLGSDKTLYLHRIPTVASAEGLLVKVILKPAEDCTTVPDFLWTDHRDTIASGAKADLLSRKGMPWYDPQLSGAFKAMFTNGYNNAKMIKAVGYTTRPLRVRMREWL